MKTNFTRCAAFVALLWTCTSVYAQQLKYNLGNAGQFVSGLQQQEAVQRENGRSVASRLILDLNPSTHLEILVNYSSSADGGYAIRGQVAEMKGTNVYLDYENGNLSGSIIIEDQAYRYSSDASGYAYVAPVDIDELICVEYGKDKHDHATHNGAPVKQSAVAAVGDAYKLQSLPGSPYVIYLDYDGYYLAAGSRWNSGNPINAAPSGFTEAQMTESWELAAEDYRPFNVNVTTDESVFNASAAGRRMRVVITPTNTAAPGSGGVAYIGSFTFTREDPCWVYNLGTKSAGETVSHEVGHTLFLQHDGRTTPAETYFAGQGNWGPIMGAPFSKPVVQWSKGEYNAANNKEDDLNIISTRNGFTYRTDAVGNTTASATPLTISSAGAITVVNGLIEKNTDLDFFSFTTSGGAVTINANPAARHGDLDILIRLYNSAGGQIGTWDGSSLAATLSTNLAAGSYYISIDGTGSGDRLTNGYSDYASLGTYSISGTIPNTTNTNTPPTVSITAPANGTTYTAPATINITATAADANGTVTKVDFYNGATLLGTDNTAPYSYSWTGVGAGSYNLTAKATDNQGAETISSVVNVVVNTATNTPPTVTLTGPTTTSYTAPASMTLTATASDANGTVAKVDFYNGATLLGTDNSSPYSYSWVGVAAGTYTLTAKATDNQGAVSVSSNAITVTVTGSTNNCTGVAQYIENGGYVAGSRVQNVGKIYECKPWPYSGWCNGAAWAYGAGTGTYWTDAWTLVGNCTARIAASQSTGIASPNPTSGLLTVNVENASMVAVMNSYGVVMIPATLVSAQGILDLSTLPSGIYMLRIDNGTEVIMEKIVKD